MDASTSYPPESTWNLLGHWYDVPEASTNYTNLTPQENTLRVGHKNRYGKTINRLEFLPGYAGVPDKVRAYWTGPDDSEWSAIYESGPVR